jgi:hypothetical protein
MEKYEKPVMMIEEIGDEIHTATTTPEPVPNRVPEIVLVSGEAVITPNNNHSPFVTYVPDT